MIAWVVETEKKYMKPEGSPTFFEGDEVAQERERAGEERESCIQEVKEDKNSQQRECYSDACGICLQQPHQAAQCILFYFYLFIYLFMYLFIYLFI